VSVTRNGCLQPALLLRNSRAIWYHTVLPVTCQRRQSRLNPSQIKLVIDLTTREGCKAKMTWLAGYIPRWHTRSQPDIGQYQQKPPLGHPRALVMSSGMLRRDISCRFINIVHMLNDTNYNVTPVFSASVLTLLPYLSLTTLLLFKHTQSS